MSRYFIQDTSLTAIGDAIRAKTGGSGALTPAQMAEAIGSISGGGGLQIASGTFSKSSASKRHEVALPFAPKYFFCYAEVTNTSGTGVRAILADIENEVCRYIIGSSSYAGGFAVGSGNYLLIYEDAIEIVCQSTHLNPDMGTYHWYALG